MPSDESQHLLSNDDLEGNEPPSAVHEEDQHNLKTRREIRRFLSSKYGHYAVLLLVSLDVSCIFGT